MRSALLRASALARRGFLLGLAGKFSRECFEPFLGLLFLVSLALDTGYVLASEFIVALGFFGFVGEA